MIVMLQMDQVIPPSSSLKKKNITDGNLYTHPEADIQKGDILYVYEKDEYDNKVESTEFKTIADRPYKKRTKLIVPLLAESEV